MSEPADVRSIEAVRDWKAAMQSFQVSAREALLAIELAIRRAFDWLEEQRHFWQQEIRRREEAVTQAKAELTRRKMLPIIGKHPDCTEQEKALRKAQQRLAEAEDKLEQCRRWATPLRRAVDEYEGPARKLAALLEGDLPRALAVLERKIRALESYVELQAASDPAASGASHGPGADTPASGASHGPGADTPASGASHGPGDQTIPVGLEDSAHPMG
jgi:hypothetical protein